MTPATAACSEARAGTRHAAVLLLLVCLMVLVGIMPGVSRAGIADAPGSDLKVALITYGPGAVYWERFGHDAIEIRDRVSGERVNFNYGVFDFNQNNFLLNFARGKMRYMAAAEHSGPEIRRYVASGRSVNRQLLNLTPKQAAHLRDMLLSDLAPENRYYHYDYFTRNCATRVRDRLNDALDGLLSKALDKPSAGITYRGEVRRLMAAQPLLMLGMDLGLATYADRPLTAWQAAFIPMHLMHELADVKTADGKPLVIHATELAPSAIPLPGKQPPELTGPLLLAGLIFALMLLASGWWRDGSRALRLIFALPATVFTISAGIAGVLMLVLWFATAHVAAWANLNLLLFNPVAWLILPSLWRRRTTRIGVALTALMVLTSTLSALVHLLPGLHQQNLAWIAFAWPVWIALLIIVARHRQPRPA